MSKRGVVNSWHLEMPFEESLITCYGLRDGQRAVEVAQKLANALGKPVKIQNVTKGGTREPWKHTTTWVRPV